MGIDPYIETVGAFHSTYRVVAWDCGRLVAAPTGYIIFTQAIVVLCFLGSRGGLIVGRFLRSIPDTGGRSN